MIEADRIATDPETGPITVQSVVQLTTLENAQNFVSLIKSPKGDKPIDRWLEQLRKDAIRKRAAVGRHKIRGYDSVLHWSRFDYLGLSIRGLLVVNSLASILEPSPRSGAFLWTA
ncbi:MAG: hypothetical protein CMN78_02020 [Spirochaetales bacterium]|nr:hypothetical protein [Spirochaetales bacterium]